VSVKLKTTDAGATAKSQ